MALTNSVTVSSSVFNDLVWVFELFPEFKDRTLEPDDESEINFLFEKLHRADEAARLGDLNGSASDEALQAVRLMLESMVVKRPGNVGLLVFILAEACRQPEWRLTLGRASFYRTARTILEQSNGVTPDVRQALRFIGNSSADQDENRQRFVESGGMPALMRWISSSDYQTLRFAVVALLNVCMDHEGCQEAAFSSGALAKLLTALRGRTFDKDDLITYICRFLVLTPPNIDLDCSNAEAIPTLLKISTNPVVDDEDGIELAKLAIRHLQVDSCQRLLVDGPSSPRLFGLLESISDCELLNGPSSEDSGALRKSIQDLIANALNRVDFQGKLCVENVEVMLPSFRKCLCDRRPFVRELALLILANVAQSDKICAHLVSHLDVSSLVIEALKASEGGIVHNALGVLRNLGLAADNQASLIEHGALEALGRVSISNPIADIRSKALQVLRIFAQSTQSVQRLLASQENLGTQKRPLLSFVVSSSNWPQAFDGAKLDAARLCVAILRTIHTVTDLGVRDELLQRLWTTHGGLASLLELLIRHTDIPASLTEGWFGFSLAASSPGGCQAVVPIINKQDVIAQIEATLREARSPSAPTKRDSTRVIEEASNTSRSQNANAANVKVLLHNLRQNSDQQAVNARLLALINI